MVEPTPFHPSRPSVMRPVAVDAHALTGPTRAQARGGRWRRTSRGFYLRSEVDLADVEQRIACAAPLLSEHDAVTGWAALRWAGGLWFAGRDATGAPTPVPISVNSRRLPQPGFSLSQESIRPWARSELDGLPVTTPCWAAAFEARYAGSWWRATEVLDMAAYSDLVSRDEMAALTAQLNSWTGVPQLRRALDRMDENSWSPQETRMRLIWTELGGHPRPLTNRAVFDRSGGHVGTPDLIDPVRGVVGEYDGALHLAGDRRRRDLKRESRFRAVGLDVVVMVAGDTDADLVERLDVAYRRSSSRLVEARGWTLSPPVWWTSTYTVAQRRSLDAAQRSRLLSHRRGAA